MVTKLSRSPQRTCSTREVANLLGISVRTAQLWVEEGRLNAWKTPGGHRRILRESVEKLLDQQRQVGLHRTPGQQILLMDNDNERGASLQALLTKLLPDSRLEQLDTFAGLIRIGEAAPDVLITDLDPGVGDNLRLLHTLAANPACNGMLKILLVESEAHWESVREPLEPHFVILTKPVEGRELASVIRTVLPLRGNKKAQG